MRRWVRLLALASVLSIGESCGLRPPAVPHLEIRGASVDAPAVSAAEAGRVRDIGVAFGRAEPDFGPAGVRSVRPS